MRLHFIRHGQTDWNVLGKIQGSYDSELNQTGLLQAEELSKRVLECDLKFSKIYSSRQKRARKTAEILSRAVQVDYIPIDGLQEVNLGLWEGLSWENVSENYPAEFEAWRHNRRYAKAPCGESYQDVLERVLAVIRQIISMGGKEVAVVTHGAVIMSLQCYLTNTPFEEMGQFKPGNASITEIDSSFFKSI